MIQFFILGLIIAIPTVLAFVIFIWIPRTNRADLNDILFEYNIDVSPEEIVRQYYSLVLKESKSDKDIHKIVKYFTTNDKNWFVNRWEEVKLKLQQGEKDEI